MLRDHRVFEKKDRIEKITVLAYGFPNAEREEIQRAVPMYGCRWISASCAEDILALPADFVLLNNTGISRREQEILNDLQHIGKRYSIGGMVCRSQGGVCK